MNLDKHPCSFCQKPCYQISYIGHRIACATCFERLAVQPALADAGKDTP